LRAVRFCEFRKMQNVRVFAGTHILRKGCSKSEVERIREPTPHIKSGQPHLAGGQKIK